MTIESAIGLFGSSLLVAAAAGRALRRRDLAPRARAALLALALLACWVPLRGLPVAGYVRGVIGDLSLPTLLLLGAALASTVTGKDWLDARERAAWFAAVAVGAVFLYPMALGLSLFDPYALGYSSYGFATVLFALTLAAWSARRYWLATSLVAGVAAYLAGLLESTNLWDYLIDPLIAAYAIFWWLRRALFGALAARRAVA